MDKQTERLICGVTGKECMECMPGGCGSVIVRKEGQAKEK